MSLKTVSGVDRFKLSQQEIQEYQKQAINGNLEAARRLRDYYAFVELNDDQTIYWAKKAGDLGDKESKDMVDYYEKAKRNK